MRIKVTRYVQSADTDQRIIEPGVYYATDKAVEGLVEGLLQRGEAVKIDDKVRKPKAAGYGSRTVDALEADARERGIYDAIEGSGAGGNIVKDDLVGALEADDEDGEIE